MFVQHPTRLSNGVLVVCDQRQKSDKALSDNTGKPHVMALNSVMKAAFGPAYSGTTRLALYDYGQKPTPKERAEARAAYRQFLADHAGEYRVAVVLPTPSQAVDNTSTVKGTQVWRDLAPPDSLDEMRGTFWETHGLLAVPVFAPLPSVGQIQLSFTRRWIQASLAIAERSAGVMCPYKPVTECGEEMLLGLAVLRNRPLAVDIETVPNSDKITAIGLASGIHAVSIPFDEFEPACGGGVEPSLASYPDGKQTLQTLGTLLAAPTTKLFQNGTYDVPLLAERGLTCGGIHHDTLAMHAIAYPESRHALQLAAATELIVPPWKSLFKPRSEEYGVLQKDNPLYWYWDAKSLRDYNAKDAFYTWHLGNALAWKVGVTL